MRMEELNRRHSTLGSPQGSQLSHRSPQGPAKSGEQNSLVVAVQQRRASIISISPENLLDVTSHSRSASVRSSHSHKHLQVGGESERSLSSLISTDYSRSKETHQPFCWITTRWLAGGKVMFPLTTAGTAASDTETPQGSLVTVLYCALQSETLYFQGDKIRE